MIISTLFALMVFSSVAFSQLDVENGLSQSSVFAITQDRDDCMWFATYDGLCRYDGNDFEVFRENEKPGSINGNIIRSLLIDSDGTLWAGTNKGFSLIKPGTDTFKNISVNMDDFYVYHMAEYDERHIVARTAKSNYLIDKETLDFSPDTTVTGISSGDVLFKRTELGLMSVSSEGYLTIRGNVGKHKTVKIRKFQKIMDAEVSRDSCIYIASEGEGFWKIDLKDGKSKQYSLHSTRARALCHDTFGNIWIGTANNLYILNPVTDQISEIAPDSSDSESLSNSSIRSLYCDRIGGVWAGTFFGGVNYFNPWRNHFGSIRYKSTDKDIVGCISEDDKGRLWVGTFRDGVICFDTDRKTYRHMGVSESGVKDETNDIKAIEFCGDKVLIGAELGGLTIYNILTGKTSRIDAKNRFSSVYCISRTSSGAYWLGTNRGLFRFDLSRLAFTKINGYGLVRRIYQHSSNEIWLGGDGFLSKCIEIKQNDGTESLLPVREFKDIFWVQDINGSGEHVWIGSRNGLYKYSIGRDEIEKIQNDAISFSVKAIEMGGNGKLWLSTENGLFSYDPSSGKFRHYGRGDGIICNTYNIGARLKLSDGSICFGGTEGITIFKPDSIVPQTYTPSPLLTRVSIDGQAMEIREDRRIDIPAGKSVISFKFTSPDYVSWKNVSFRYRLDGFDSLWHEADISRTATYSSLPKGRYTFMVESSNADGVKSLSQASLVIRVHPHWYQTTLFNVFIILLVALFVAYLINNHIRGIRKDTSEQIEGLKLRLYSGPKVEEQLSDEDSKFLKQVLKVVYDNISNENFSADMFAREMGLSRTGLHTRLKAITGESALEFIKKVRFNEACSLLSKGSLSVAEVGYKVGYSSPAYFTSSFKKRIGKTPKEYQEITRKS